MNLYKKLKAFISITLVVLLALCTAGVPAAAADANTVTATTSATVKQGSSAYCYVYIDSTEGIAALDVTVHFDSQKVKITSLYNSVGCTLYDSVTNADNIQFSYILDGKGTASKTRLFYFYYQVLSDAEVGGAYFDITVGEAYDSALNDLEVFGSQCSFTINEEVISKSCSVYGSGTALTSISEEFALSYRFSSYQIASGTAVITYDPELFEVVSVTNGAFLNGKLADVNCDLAGSVYISFVGTEYNTNKDLVTVKFKTLKNTNEVSKIALSTTELCDLELNSISCTGCNTDVTVAYNDEYLEDAPKMLVSAEYDGQTNKVTATVKLEQNSRLGAGDFVLEFDPAVLTLTSYQKGFEPNFFYINDKEAAEGVLKFSIISLEDILAEQDVISLSFDATQTCNEQTVTLDISGSMLSDSLTNSIKLNLIDAKATVLPKHAYYDKCDTDCDLCGAVREAEHYFEWTLITNATKAEDGVFEQVCSACQAKGEQEVFEYVAVKQTRIICNKDGKSVEVSIDAGCLEKYSALSVRFCQNGKYTLVSEYETAGNNLIFKLASQDDSDLAVDIIAVTQNGNIAEIAQDKSRLDRFSGANGEQYMQYAVLDKGDANGDGFTNVKDLVRMKKILVELEDVTPDADISGNGNVSVADMVSLARYITTAQKGIRIYTVTFADSDGSILETLYVPTGFGAKPTVTPQKDGYVFKGWDTKLSNVTADKIIKAVFEAA